MAAAKPTYDLMLLLDTDAPDERAREDPRRRRAARSRATAARSSASTTGASRALAYEIRHKTDAEYHLLQFHGPPDAARALDRTLRITDGVAALPHHQARAPARRPPPDAPPGRAARRAPPRPSAARAPPAERAAAEPASPRRAALTPSRQSAALRDVFATQRLATARLARRQKPPSPRLDSPTRLQDRSPKGATPMAATNINRVVMTGNLTRDPELRSLPSGTSVCRLRVAVQHAPQGRRDRRVGRQAQLLRRHGLGRAGRELRPVPRQGPPGRHRRPPRVARVGERGRAASARRSISSPTPSSSSAAATTPAAAAAATASRRAVRRPGRHRRLPAAAPAGGGARSPADDDIPF